MANVVIPKDVTQEDIERALKMLETSRNRRAKAKERRKDPEYKEKMRTKALRRRAINKLTLAKALAAGITVTESEIEKFIATQEG